MEAGTAKESDMDEEDESGKKESSRLGEGTLLFLGPNIVLGLRESIGEQHPKSDRSAGGPDEKTDFSGKSCL